MVKMKAPAGATDVSFGGQNFKVDKGGVVEVPAEAELTLFQFGFTRADNAANSGAPKMLGGGADLTVVAPGVLATPAVGAATPSQATVSKAQP